ncbi:MAG: glycosyltransferase family 39 protein [Pseudomonadota bacterium]
MRLWRLDSAALWFDETFTASWIELPLPQMMRVVLSDNHLPFYFLMLKAWTAIVGTSPEMLRLPSAIFSLLTIPLIGAIAWVIKDKTAARWAAWLAALSPYLLQHAQEARMYTLLGLLAAANTFLLIRFVTNKSQHLGITFVLINAGLLATHYYSIFFIAAEFLALLILASNRWRFWAVAMAVTLAMMAGPVLAAKYLATPHAGGSYQMGIVALPGLIWSLISGYTLLPSSAELHAEGPRAALTYLPLALAGFVALSVTSFAALRCLPKTHWLPLIIICGTVILGPFFASMLFDVGNNPRYAMACCPALLAFVVAGFPNTMNDRIRVGAAAVLIIIMVSASTLHLANPGHGREDIYGIGEWLDANVPIEEEILVTSDEMATLAKFHWPQRHFRNYPSGKTVVKRSGADDVAAALPFGNANRVIYIFGRTWVSDPNDALRAALTTRYNACPGIQARGIEVLCLTPVKPVMNGH